MSLIEDDANDTINVDANVDANDAEGIKTRCPSSPSSSPSPTIQTPVSNYASTTMNKVKIKSQKRGRQRQRVPSVTVNHLTLGKASLRQRLEDYYSLIAPDVISKENGNEKEWKRKFDLIYEKFGGTEKGERMLSAKLCKKYGNAVRLRLVVLSSSSSESNTNTNASSGAGNVAKREESWYDISQHKNQQNSGIVDFTSENFDPIATLSLPSSQITQCNPFIQNVPLLDNISKFVYHLPHCDPLMKINLNQQKKRKHNGIGGGADGASSNSASTSTTKRKLPILSSIASQYENSGPLSLLYTIHTKKQRIRVMIRYADCIRSTLTGFILAFDKHMNMILRDVDEVYTPRVTKLYHDRGYSKAELEFKRRTCIVDGDKHDGNDGMRGISSSSNGGSNNEPLVRVKQRHFQQLLVRGDNVVMVWRASTERSAWPKTMISPERSIYETSSSSNGSSSCTSTSIGDKSNKSINNSRNSTNRKGAGTPGSLLLGLR
jgi:small nuclear ribonucleoprotein (snRNP)-like protein